MQSKTEKGRENLIYFYFYLFFYLFILICFIGTQLAKRGSELSPVLTTVAQRLVNYIIIYVMALPP